MIIRKTPREIALMREAGRIVAKAHEAIAAAIRPGISTLDLDEIARNVIQSYGATASFKGYGGFKGHICASVNEELVHGIPNKKKILNDGDVISIDIGANYKGYHGDSAWTYGVGTLSAEDKKLLEITEKSLYVGLSEIKPGVRLSTVSHHIGKYIEDNGFSVVEEYTGHGIGSDLHEDPAIPNYGEPNQGPILKEGMVLAIEPMVNAGERYVHTLKDGWTVVTNDKKKCAHFEHTIVVTSDGYEILTTQ